MNGYAGQSPLRSQKLENSMSKGCARNSKRACAGLVVGWAAFTARISQLALRYSMCSTNNLKSHHSGYSSSHSRYKYFQPVLFEKLHTSTIALSTCVVKWLRKYGLWE